MVITYKLASLLSGRCNLLELISNDVTQNFASSVNPPRT